MTKRHTRQADGKFHIDGKKYELNTGSRAQVFHETAYKTTGGLRKKDLMKTNMDVLFLLRNTKLLRKSVVSSTWLHC